MNFFDELKASMEQAVDIKEGRTAPGRVTCYEIADVRNIRERLDVSQAEFAHTLGASVDTVKSWESKRRNPTGIAATLMRLLQDNPEIYYKLNAS